MSLFRRHWRHLSAFSAGVVFACMLGTFVWLVVPTPLLVDPTVVPEIEGMTLVAATKCMRIYENASTNEFVVVDRNEWTPLVWDTFYEDEGIRSRSFYDVRNSPLSVLFIDYDPVSKQHIRRRYAVLDNKGDVKYEYYDTDMDGRLDKYHEHASETTYVLRGLTWEPVATHILESQQDDFND